MLIAQENIQTKIEMHIKKVHGEKKHSYAVFCKVNFIKRYSNVVFTILILYQSILFSHLHLYFFLIELKILVSQWFWAILTQVKMQKNSQLTKLTSKHIGIQTKDPNDRQDLSFKCWIYTKEMNVFKKTNVQKSFYKDWNFQQPFF